MRGSISLTALLVVLAVSVRAGLATTIEVTYEVERGDFSNVIRPAQILTFNLYDSETAASAFFTQNLAPQDVVVEDILILPTLRKARLSAVVGPVDLADKEEVWVDVAADNMPPLLPRQQAKTIPFAVKARENGIPTGAILLWDGGPCPLGFSAVSSYNDRFLVASDVAGITGGSSAHTHGPGSYSGPSHAHGPGSYSGPSHTHSETGAGTQTQGCGAGHWHFYKSDGNRDGRTCGDAGTTQISLSSSGTGSITGTSADAGAGAVTGTSASADSRPEFRTITLCRKD